MSANEQLAQIAQRMIWWKTPEETLAWPARFIMQVMTRGRWDDVLFVQGVYGKEAFKEALLHAEPGVFDMKSWTYWHTVFGLPVGPLPQRTFD
jgi:hypothetical protein